MLPVPAGRSAPPFRPIVAKGGSETSVAPEGLISRMEAYPAFRAKRWRSMLGYHVSSRGAGLRRRSFRRRPQNRHSTRPVTLSRTPRPVASRKTESPHPFARFWRRVGANPCRPRGAHLKNGSLPSIPRQKMALHAGLSCFVPRSGTREEAVAAPVAKSEFTGTGERRLPGMRGGVRHLFARLWRRVGANLCRPRGAHLKNGSLPSIPRQKMALHAGLSCFVPRSGTEAEVVPASSAKPTFNTPRDIIQDASTSCVTQDREPPSFRPILAKGGSKPVPPPRGSSQKWKFTQHSAPKDGAPCWAIMFRPAERDWGGGSSGTSGTWAEAVAAPVANPNLLEQVKEGCRSMWAL